MRIMLRFTNSIVPWNSEKMLLIGVLFPLVGGLPQIDFPFTEFYGLRNLDFDQKYNIRLQLCNGYRGVRRSGDCCDCQDACILTKTCCVDALWDRSRIEDMNAYKQYLIGSSKSSKNVDCENVFSTHPGDFFKHLSVTTCPQEASEEEKEECSNSKETVENSIPVKGNDNYVYRNQYCARCNNVDEFQLLPLTVHSKAPLSAKKESSIQVAAYFDEPCQPYDDTCNPGNMYYDLCHSFLGPGMGLRNYFCALCINSTEYFYFSGNCMIGGVPNFPYTWSTLLQLSDVTRSETQVSCANRKLNDFLLNKCEMIPCPLGYAIVDSKCKNIINRNSLEHLISNNEKIFDTCSLRKTLVIQIFNIVNVTTEYLNISWESIIQREGLSSEVLSSNDQMTVLRLTGVRTMSILESLLDQILQQKPNRHGKVIISSNLYPDDYSLALKNVFSHGRYCANPVKISQENITENCEVITNTSEVIYYQNLSFIQEIDIYTRKRLLYTCHEFYLDSNCPLRILKSNVSIDENFKMKFETADNQTDLFNVNEYIPLKYEGYGVCIKSMDVKKLHWIDNANRVEGVMSLVGSTLSILSYLLQLLMFFFLEELQTFANLSVLALSICLLATDGSFFIGNILYITKFESTLLCQILGILGHVSYMSALIWGAAISSDVFDTVRKYNNQQSQSKMKFCCHCVTAFLLSVIIIAIVVVLDQFGIISGRYGRNNICALHGFGGRLIFYAIPLGISSFLSIIFFLGSLHHIFKEMKRNSEVLGNENQSIVKLSLLKVAVKLVFITGFAEMVGLFTLYHISTDNNELILKTILSFLYSFLKGFRGVMLFIAYSGNKLVTAIKQRSQKSVTESSTREDLRQQES